MVLLSVLTEESDIPSDKVLLLTHLQGVISLQRNKRQECIFKTSFYGQSLKNLI